MPKSKAKRRKKRGTSQSSDISWGGKASPGARRINIVLGVLVLGLVVAGAAYWFLGAQSERAFQAIADQGRARLSAAVITNRNDGPGHGEHGAAYAYDGQFPTSGRHDPVPTSPGVYRVPLRPGQLVHALEHGHVVIYYDTPEPDALATLKDWAGLYDGQWDGVVVAPMDGLGRDLVLTAWTKTLRLRSFDGADAALAAAFIDAYRGRGPEHPVRVDLE
jgi:hypothetical protein